MCGADHLQEDYGKVIKTVPVPFCSPPTSVWTPDMALTHDDKRLVVTDYFLDMDDFGKIYFEGDHRVHVIKVFKNHLELDTRFNLDFDTAFDRPARPHGMEMK